MKITPNAPSRGPELERLNSQGRNATNGPATATGGEDAATLSSGQAAIGRLKAQLRTVPEVRAERVAQLQNALANGTYTVNPTRVAQAMIADLTGRQD